MLKKNLIFICLVIAAVLVLVYYFKYQSKDQLFTVMKVPDFTMTNQNQQHISPKDMLGKVYVVEFFFTNCPTICPVMNENLKEIVNEINSPDLGVFSITIDPKRDTPEALKVHQQKLKIDNPNWYFLTANRDSIYAVSKKFNIFIGKDMSTAEGLEHSGKMALVDKKGRIRSRYNENGIPILYYSGLNYDKPKNGESKLEGKYHPEINWLKEDIKILLKE